MVIVLQSNNVDLPSSTITDNIIAMETMFTVSKKALVIFDFLIRGMSGLSNATNKNEGRNIPIVAAIAPDASPICHPMNVAEEKTGPGVNCPTAMASTSCCFVSNPLLTSSASKKAKST